MDRSTSRKRPWLAAVLGTLVTGLGHVYLRRWRRALGWLAALFGVAALFVDPSALESLSVRGDTEYASVAPILVVGALSVVDAYVVARRQHAGPSDGDAATPDGTLARCPNCGEELDPDLDFCHWCTTELDGMAAAARHESDERDR